jgi:hypothetical protein
MCVLSGRGHRRGDLAVPSRAGEPHGGGKRPDDLALAVPQRGAGAGRDRLCHCGDVAFRRRLLLRVGRGGRAGQVVPGHPERSLSGLSARRPVLRRPDPARLLAVRRRSAGRAHRPQRAGRAGCKDRPVAALAAAVARFDLGQSGRWLRHGLGARMAAGPGSAVGRSTAVSRRRRRVLRPGHRRGDGRCGLAQLRPAARQRAARPRTLARPSRPVGRSRACGAGR